MHLKNGYNLQIFKPWDLFAPISTLLHVVLSSTSCIYTVRLTIISLLSSGPPRINGPIEKQHQKTPVGSTVRLRCPVIAHPPALTMWQKDGETINNIWERFKVKEAGLRIENVVKEDSGQYICRGTNGFGTVSINFTLRVIGM